MTEKQAAAGGLQFLTLLEAARKRTYSCTHQGCTEIELAADAAFVPVLEVMYREIRGTDVERMYPLSVGEIAGAVVCRRHAFAPATDGTRTKMFGVLGTVGVMDRWAEQNARRLAETADHRRERSEVRRESDLAWALRRDDLRSPVNRIIAVGGAPWRRAKKGRQYKGGPKPGADRSDPHFGEYRRPAAAAKGKKKSKKKGGGDQQGGKKGRH